MVIEIIVILVCILFMFFSLYALSKEDFVFLRKNISLDHVFDIAGISIVVSLFFSRLFFALFSFDLSFLNPLVFFLIPYFPGLSLTGAVIGGLISVFIISRKRRYPTGRLIDFFSVAFLSVLPIGYLGYLFSDTGKLLIFSILPIFYYIFLLIFYWKILFPRFLQGQMRDGMLGLLLIMNYSLFTLILKVLSAMSNKTVLVTFESGVLAGLFLISLILYFRQGAQIIFRR